MTKPNNWQNTEIASLQNINTRKVTIIENEDDK